MTKAAVEAFRSEREVLASVLSGLTPEEWAAPSGCEGWSVHDVVIHLVTSLQLVADPANARFPDPALGAEAGIDAIVADRRGESAADTLAAWLDMSAKAIDAFEVLQTDGVAENELDMGELGKHPMHMIANAYAFDQYTHLRVDLLTPRGPLGNELPEVEPVVLEATAEWLLAGLPFMCTEALKPVTTAPWRLRLTGVCAGAYTVAPVDDPVRACTVTAGESGDAAFTVETDVEELVRWGTHRTPWRGNVTIDGDEELAARVLDAVRLI
jgi:uncharacterized protein (TIGR03083 family)